MYTRFSMASIFDIRSVYPEIVGQHGRGIPDMLYKREEQAVEKSKRQVS